MRAAGLDTMTDRRAAEAGSRAPAPQVEMRTVLDVTIPVRTENESNRGAGGSRNPFGVARARKRTRGAVGVMVKAHLPELSPLIWVTLVRYSAGKLDDDGLRSALKSVRDAVAAQLGVDDGSPLILFEYLQHRVPPKTYGVRVLIRFREAAREATP